MARSIIADVTPDVLRWARETLGLSVEEAASKLGVDPDRVAAWESGKAAPTVVQLRKMADVYKRPIAVFFLDTPPADIRPPKDYRRLPDNVNSPFSPRLRLQIRRATYRQSIAAEFVARRRTELISLFGQASFSEGTDVLAELVRPVLGITIEQQRSWREPSRALKQWVSALETQGVLIFQASGVDVSEMRGVSFPHENVPAILLNASDSPAGRVFTLFHEVGHFLLGETGLCDLCDWEQEKSSVTRAEVFCNQFSASLLLPRGAVLGHPVVARHMRPAHWDDDELLELRQDFAVSTEAIARRLVSLQKATMSFYLSKRIEFSRAAEEYRKSLASREPRPPFHRRILAMNGPSFTRLVVGAYREEEITGSELSEYLGMKLQHLGKIEEALFASSAG